MDFEVRGVLRRTGREIEVSGGVTGRRVIVLRISSPDGGQIPAFLKAEVIFSLVKLAHHASRNSGQKVLFVIVTSPRLVVTSLLT
jgi:hypothetical protein